ncbi:MAG: hypothetical protein U9R65_16100, partial [Pseudomonadota bacterium]|nr:hypothetical protein [Pseudomonadota bacterium]
AYLKTQQIDPLLAEPVVPHSSLESLEQSGVVFMALFRPTTEYLGLVPPTPIQPISLQLRGQQSELLTLSVNTQKAGCQMAQESHGDYLIVDEDSIAPLPTDLAPHHKLGFLRFNSYRPENRSPLAILGLKDTRNR